MSTPFWIPALAIGLGAAIVGWGVARMAARALGHHRRHLAHLNQVQLVELFLFVEPATFLRINLIVLLIATVVFGWLAGLYGAALAMLLTAVAPRALYLWLRKRRLRALERQLPDIADSLASGGLGIVDYYKIRNLQADTDMRRTIAGVGNGPATATHAVPSGQ